MISSTRCNCQRCREHRLAYSLGQRLQEAMLTDLTLTQLRQLCKKMDIKFSLKDTKEDLINLLEDDDNYPLFPHSPYKPSTLIPATAVAILIAKALETPYWSTPAGIDARIDALAQDHAYKIINEAMKITWRFEGAEWFRWILHPELSKTGPCTTCQANASGGNGDGYYRSWWFMPEFPSHPNCVCELEIIYDPEHPYFHYGIP